MLDVNRYQKLHRGFLVLLCILASLLPVLSVGFYFLSIYGWVEPEQLGQFGDFVGGLLNPLFSVFSLLFIAFSLLDNLANTAVTYEQNRIALDVAIQQNTLAAEQLRVAVMQLESDLKKQERNSSVEERRLGRNLTLTWHQDWMSPQMSLLKANVLGDIQTRILNIEAGQASAFIGGLRNTAAVQIRKTHHEIKDVMRSILQAITFFEDELLDKELFLKLIESDFRQWHSVLNRLDMRANPSDESPDSLSEDAERQRLVERLARVLGLS